MKTLTPQRLCDVWAFIYSLTTHTGILLLEYEAVSYVWGSEDNPVSLNCDGREMKMTQSLAGALRRFRQEGYARTLWVDSICINQADLLEKSAQVPMMSNIFRRASCVLIWLGEERQDSDDASKAFRCMTILNKNFSGREELHKYHNMTFKDKSRYLDQVEREFRLPSRDDVAALNNLFESPWFGRAWTFQEIQVARNSNFYLGLYRMEVEMLYHSRVTLDQLAASTQDFRFLVRRNPLALYSFVQHSVKDSITSDTRRTLRFLSTMSVRRGAGCKDPHDLIYSILNIVQDGPSIKINYAQPWPEMFAESTAQYINQSESLEILNQALPKTDLTTLPSWVPDWRLGPDHNLGGAMRLTNLTGRPYRCTASSNVDGRLSSSCRDLSLQGLLWDSILAVTESSPKASAFKWMQRQAFNLHGDQTLNSPEQEELPTPDSTSCFYEPTGQNFNNCCITLCLLDIDPTQGLGTATSHRWRSSSIERDTETTSYDEFKKLIGEASETNMSQRRIAFTQHGRFGVVPKAARVGDTIAILMGGDVPILLRPDPSDHKYEFVGECYMHGFMDGQALVEARRKAEPDYDHKDTSWLERLHEEPLPFPTVEITIK
ncbi:uncharacterized protein KY384_004642 [Bacidia gigantensis]|uniref:uncharacterized protein n=1 Tax=Bacidia gigantensis TaxID=2732470 RepID=UPI001D046B52|nr:uncharacterized protein KY384_004642 [Bacidia gigantensis]KAG8530604.1 hypothetical protein KY384_004642 [Bacidia gigantensis]